jgi:hypothetical protein
MITDGVGYNGGFPVIGGRTYAFNAYLPCTVDGTTAGVKILANGGSCTFSSFSGVGNAYAASSVANLASTSTSTPTLVESVAAYTLIRLLRNVHGCIERHVRPIHRPERIRRYGTRLHRRFVR